MRIMNLWPEWPWSARRKAATNGGIAASLREGQGMGVWQDIMGKWQPRSRNPYLLEALREAIPILDGGHLLYYLIELVKGSPLSERAMIFGQYVGAALLVGLMGLAFYNDILRLVS